MPLFGTQASGSRLLRSRIQRRVAHYRNARCHSRARWRRPLCPSARWRHRLLCHRHARCSHRRHRRLHRVDLAALLTHQVGSSRREVCPHRLLLWRHRPCHRHARWLHRRLYLHRHRWLHHQCRRHACRHHRWHHHQCLLHSSSRASEAVHRLRFQTMRTATSTPSWLEAQGALLRPQHRAHRRRWHPHHSRALAVAVEGTQRIRWPMRRLRSVAGLERQSSRLVEAVAMRNTWRSGEVGAHEKGV